MRIAYLGHIYESLNFLPSFNSSSVLLGGLLYEAVGLNGQYLKSIAGDDQRLQSAKANVTQVLSDAHLTVDQNRQAKIFNILVYLELKEGLPSNTSTIVHDIISNNGVDLLLKFNSDSKVADLEALDEKLQEKARGGLSYDEQCIWYRVEVFHEFEDGFKWVIAVDNKGNRLGFMPSVITQKMMRHCGNEPSKMEGDVYYGLRDSRNKEYVTVILDGEGKIKESKGYGNAPPHDKKRINKYMQWLMMHSNVTGTSYEYSYAPHMNYGVSQMIDDDEFVSKVETEKPGLINDEIDGPIIKWKRAIKSGEKTVNDLIETFKNGEESIVFSSVIGVLGKNPFSEDEMIELLKGHKLTAIDIIQAGSQYMTVKIQHFLVDDNRSQSVNALIAMYNEIPNNNIDIAYILNSGFKSGGGYTNSFSTRFDELSTESKLKVVSTVELDPRGITMLLDAYGSKYMHIVSQGGNYYGEDDPEDMYKLISTALSHRKDAKELVSSRDPKGRLAVRDFTHSPEFIELFCEYGFNPNEKIYSNGSDSMFTYALSKYEVPYSVIEILIDNGGIIDSRNIYSLIENYPHLLGELLPKIPEVSNALNSVENDKHRTALMSLAVDSSIYEGDSDKIVYILTNLFKAGANPNIVDGEGETCLHYLFKEISTNSGYGVYFYRTICDDMEVVTKFFEECLKNGFNLTPELHARFVKIVDSARRNKDNGSKPIEYYELIEMLDYYANVEEESEEEHEDDSE